MARLQATIRDPETRPVWPDHLLPYRPWNSETRQ